MLLANLKNNYILKVNNFFSLYRRNNLNVYDKKMIYEDVFYSDYDILTINHKFRNVQSLIIFPKSKIHLLEFDDNNYFLIDNFDLAKTDLQKYVQILFFVFLDTKIFVDSNILQKHKKCYKYCKTNNEFYFHSKTCNCESIFQNNKVIIEKNNNLNKTSKKNKTLNFILPPLTSKSGGGIAIKRLINKLQKNNFNINILNYGNTDHTLNARTFIPIKESLYSRTFDKSFVITFDTAKGLPFKFTNHIKWNLNYPGSLPFVSLGNFSGESEITFKYSNFILEDFPRLFINNIDYGALSHWMNKANSKDLCILYLGKNSNKISVPKLFSLMDKLKIDYLVTRNRPNSKIDLYELLSRSRIMYSFDTVSALNFEASLLGCKVILDDMFEEFESKYFLSNHDIGFKNFYWNIEDAMKNSDVDNYEYFLASKKRSHEIENLDFLYFIDVVKNLN